MVDREAFLFVYGTLMRHHQAHHLLKGRTEYFGRGQVHGRLSKTSRYPALISEATPDSWVQGEIYHVMHDDLWESLDNYEGKEYRRSIAKVFTPARGYMTAWTY